MGTSLARGGMLVIGYWILVGVSAERYAKDLIRLHGAGGVMQGDC